MKQNSEKSDLIKNSNSVWVLFLGTLVTTLYFNTNIQDPFNTPKMALLLLISSWLLGYLLKSYANNFKVEKSFEFTGLIIVISFNFFLLIAFFFTDLKIVGLIGDTQRRNGLLSYLALSIFFLYAMQVAQLTFIRRFLIISIFTCLILSTYGVIQILGFDFVAWDNPYNNMIGTLGNPNFASALLATIGFLSFVSIFIKEISRIIKLVAFISGVLSVFAIVQSDSRQGLISMAISFLVFMSLFTYLKSKMLGKFFILSSLSLFLLGILGMLQKGPLQGLLYKNSVSVRGYYWRAGLEMFRDHPLTGVGLDSYNWYFKQYREVGYALTYGYNITSSNAHNTIIQLFATGGTFVGLAYVSLILLVTFCGLQNVRKLPKNEKNIAIILLAAWIGFQSQSFVSIDNLGISVWGWVIGGLILGQSHNFKKTLNGKKLTSKSQRAATLGTRDLLQPIISTILLSVSLVISVLLIQAESNTYIARSYATMKNPTGQEIVKNSLKKLETNPLADPYYKFVAAQALIDTGLDLEGYSEIKKLSEQDPRNLAYLNAIAYYSEVFKEVTAAKDTRIRIANLDPWNLRNLFLLGEIYASQGELLNARKLFLEIIRLGPNTEEATQSKDKLAIS
jgi:O-antigen ligase